MQSEQINELAAALAKAQGAMTGASKDAQNPHFKAKYATLDSVIDVVRAPFSENGLAYIQSLRNVDGERRLVTRLMHNSGQFLEDDGVPLLVDKANMQGLGSALTYARRYGLMAAAGVAPEDDDGNAAMANAAPKGETLSAPKKVKQIDKPEFWQDQKSDEWINVVNHNGEYSSFPRTVAGAAQAIQLLEELVEENGACWPPNAAWAEVVREKLGDKVDKKAPDNRADMTFKERITYLEQIGNTESNSHDEA